MLVCGSVDIEAERCESFSQSRGHGHDRPAARRDARGHTDRAAARMPAWRIPPPASCGRGAPDRSARRSLQTSDPAGAPSPFDRQNETESNPSTQAGAGMPLATTAFQRRAPSRCSRRPRSFAAVTTARTCLEGEDAAARGVVRVLDRHRAHRARSDRWSRGGSAATTSSALKKPLLPMVWMCTPDRAAAAPDS